MHLPSVLHTETAGTIQQVPAFLLGVVEGVLAANGNAISPISIKFFKKVFNLILVTDKVCCS